MLELPYRIASGVTVAAVPVASFMGRYRVHDEDVDAEVQVYDPATGAPVSPAVPAPWGETPITAEDLEELVSIGLKEVVAKKLVVRIVTGDGREYRVVPEHWGEWCNTFEESPSSQVEAAVPGEAPLDRPAVLRASGDLLWYAWDVIQGVTLSMRVYAGTVGYLSEGAWKHMDGILLYVDAYGMANVSGVTVYTPWGTLRFPEDARYALLRTADAYIKVTDPYIYTC